ncbi:MAG: peroxiredoxin [Polyangiaceae bacterium]
MNHPIGALGALSCVLAIACTTSPPAGGAATAAPALASSPAASVAAPTVPAVPPPSGSEDLVGKPAPDFSATAQDGSTVHLGALKGKSVVLYFYPKDETPGCTKEACSFRDAWASIAKTGAVLIGVSADTTDSHKSFAAHYNLPFLLVTDADGSVGRSYGVPFRGHHARQTFVIGPDGNVRKAYREVDVAVHAQQVLGDLTHPS